MMKPYVVIILVACFLAIVGSNAIRAKGVKQNCQNVITLRDAFDNIISLADANTPEGASADNFYERAHKELENVTC